jgi:DNA helicase II / ATP-dependent DNA helicase PcrA
VVIPSRQDWDGVGWATDPVPGVRNKPAMSASETAPEFPIPGFPSPRTDLRSDPNGKPRRVPAGEVNPTVQFREPHGRDRAGYPRWMTDVGAGWDEGLEGEALRMAASQAARIKALSGPGTGKTFATMRRVHRLLAEGVPPECILVVTLTRTAAEDLKRALGKLGVEGADKVVARTLHSHCFSILSRARVLEATHVVPRILASFERTMMLRDIEGDFGDLEDRRAQLLLYAASWARGAEGHAPGEPVEELDQQFQDQIIRWLRWHLAMLLEELVPQALRYLRLDPLAPELDEFDHVLVDEYQDLNRADMAVIDLLARGGSLSVVGDDDQSIYRFRHAFPEGIRNFEADDEMEFTECRRCPKAVIHLANALVGRDPARAKADLEPVDGSGEGEVHHVRFRSADNEADGLANFIARRIGQERVGAGDCLVLVNSRRHGRRIRHALVERGVAAETFFREEALDSEMAREAITLLTLRLNPEDRVAQRAWLGIDQPDARAPAYRRIWAEADEAGIPVAEAMERIKSGDLQVPWSHKAVGRWDELMRRLGELEPLGDDLDALIDALLPAGDDDLESLRSAALLALRSRDEGTSLADFPMAVRYAISQPDVPFDAQYVRIMSLHRSKGLSAQLVAIAGMVDGVIPRDPPADATMDQQQAHREEQRRILYVGITRSSETLVLSSFAEVPFAEAMRFGARFGEVRRRGEEVVVRTYASPLLAELGETLPDAVIGNDW